jgi:hypothetical protein
MDLFHLTIPGNGTPFTSSQEEQEIPRPHHDKDWNSLHLTTPGTGTPCISLRQDVNSLHHMYYTKNITPATSPHQEPELPPPHYIRDLNSLYLTTPGI